MAPRNSKKDNNKNGPPASHPQENYVEHRAFLIRSLQRNDVDLAALTDLNRSLQKSKQAILQSCGELILLDLGQGRLTLVNDELHMKTDSADEGISDEQHDFPLTPIQKQLCVDFLLRMKLRRKLSNRLARRLGRLAHAMDGEDVAPPAPPKFGDLRLHIDPAAVQQYADHWQRQEAAKKRILSMEPPDPFGSLLPMPVPKREESSQVVTDTEEAMVAASKGEDSPTKKENTKENKEETKEENQEEDAKQEKKEVATPMETEPTGETKMDVDTEKAPEAPAPADAVPPEAPAATPAPAGDDQGSPAAPAVHEDKAPDAVESTDAATATAVKPPPTASSTLLSPPPMDEAALAEYQRDIDILREFDSIYEKVWNPTSNTYQYTLAEEEPQEDPSGNKYPAGIGASHRTMSARERETEHKRWQTALLARIPEQPTFEELGLANRVFFLGERRKRCLERENEQDDENEEPKTKKPNTDDGEEKGEKIDSKDEKTSAKKLKKDSEEEENDVDEKKGAKEGDDDDSDLLEGDEDKKAEKKRGKKGSDDDSSSDMFDDKSDDEEKADKREKANKKKAKDGSDSESESSDMFDDKSDDEDEKRESKEGKRDSDDADDSGENKEEEGERKIVGGKTPLVPKLKTKDKEEEEKKEEEEEKQEEPIKRIRPMSLAPVPSFHEQDLKRICMIHADLMGASMHEHARKRLQDVTKEYNTTFRISNELFERRLRRQMQLQNFMYERQMKMLQMKKDYNVEVAIARNKWQKDKQEHDVTQTKSAMPTNWGRQPAGTSITSGWVRAPGLPNIIGTCVADLVDGAIMLSEGKIRKENFRDFALPIDKYNAVDPQTGESMAQQHMRMDAEIRKDMSLVNDRMNASEKERDRAWKKMLKTKAEFELPHSQNQSGNSRRKMQIDLSNYHLMPVPSLRASSQEAMPQEFVGVRTQVASYTPPRSSLPDGFDGAGGSESKYSAARVRERISNDGTVAPVSEPKKSKDGLYQRPAGRTRKGMQWDAFKGIWVPYGSGR